MRSASVFWCRMLAVWGILCSGDRADVVVSSVRIGVRVELIYPRRRRPEGAISRSIIGAAWPRSVSVSLVASARCRFLVDTSLIFFAFSIVYSSGRISGGGSGLALLGSGAWRRRGSVAVQRVVS